MRLYLETRDVGDRERWDALLDALDALSPLIEDIALGRAVLDMRGSTGDPRAWMERARAVLTSSSHGARLGCGPNTFCARAAAFTADGAVCAAGEARAFLAPLPLTLLELDAEIVARLHLLGIATLGELAALPYGPFVRRFGRDSGRWHELARGIERAPFRPRAHAVLIDAALFGEGCVDDETQIFFAIRMLLTRIANDLERAGMRAGALQLDVEFENGDAETLPIPLALPTAQERAMFEIVRAKLEGQRFPAPVCGLRLRAAHLEAGGEEQPLFAADDVDRERVATAIARLEGALGDDVGCARARAAHAFEDRFRYERFPLPAHATSAPVPPDPKLVPQLRLTPPREVAVRLRGGQPALVGSRAVLECVGPWRIEERTYVTTPLVRDEYDVLLEDGMLARIYRQGTRWYVRGTYD